MNIEKNIIHPIIQKNKYTKTIAGVSFCAHLISQPYFKMDSLINSLENSTQPPKQSGNVEKGCFEKSGKRLTNQKPAVVLTVWEKWRPANGFQMALK